MFGIFAVWLVGCSIGYIYLYCNNIGNYSHRQINLLGVRSNMKPTTKIILNWLESKNKTVKDLAKATDLPEKYLLRCMETGFWYGPYLLRITKLGCPII